MEDDHEYVSSVLVEGQGVDIIPEVASSYKPVKGMRFSSIDQAFDFYYEYAKKTGFGARKDGYYVHGGVLKTKYFTCCKEGHKPAKMYDSKGYCNESSKPYYKRRKRPTIRCGCRAHIQLKFVEGDFFEVDDFVEGHNHRMVADSDMQFVRYVRKLTHVQEEAIYELSNMNLGPVKAFNLMRTQYGGFEKLGATKDDSKNFKQGLNCYIGEYDAEMIVQRLCAKKTFSSDCSFEYDVNDDRELIRLYKIVFVLFTAIDNHCHSVTVVVTDQDPVMKQDIAAVFPNTRHMLCMWHIMKKVADKVGADLCNKEDFKSRLCNIVWTDSISPLEVEKKWQAIMVEFELDKNKWLTDMYEIRFDWIHAFYRDELLFGLMRTRSRSESENHFFGKATNSQLTLLEFFNHFDFCMEIQRYNGRRCDHDSRYTYPQLETRSYLEREAIRIYTRDIFNDLQDEMNEIVGGVHNSVLMKKNEGF
ncbi:protein FAR1-RELATED SEQUENCE 5-like [Bidens hawaiensis]|uniref:protein FAR1-RELATED SEQUENCE 5-like n=1 Tax=Bidens hawaiensis TaxID=980011 RepID=UPI00404AF37A